MPLWLNYYLLLMGSNALCVCVLVFFFPPERGCFDIVVSLRAVSRRDAYCVNLDVSCLYILYIYGQSQALKSLSTWRSLLEVPPIKKPDTFLFKMQLKLKASSLDFRTLTHA